MQTIQIKRGSLPKLIATMDIGRDGQLTDCTVAMRIKAQDGSLLNEYSCTITSAAAGIVEYQFMSGDTETAGNFWMEFWVNVPVTGMLKIPSDNYVNFVIMQDLS